MGVDGGSREAAQTHIWGSSIRQAAQGSVVHNDDTGMRILKLVRNTGDGRTGTFTSGIVSICREWRIVLYFTGWKHAGENLADVLNQRAAERDAPIQMCDALSRNTPKLPGVEVLLANCLAHGRRQVVDVAANFPEECRYVLESLRRSVEDRRRLDPSMRIVPGTDCPALRYKTKSPRLVPGALA